MKKLLGLLTLVGKIFVVMFWAGSCFLCNVRERGTHEERVKIFGEENAKLMEEENAARKNK